MKNLNLDTILLIALAVFVTLQVRSCFSKAPVDEEAVRAKVELERLKEEIPVIRQERDEYRRESDSLKDAINQRIVDLENRKQPILNVIRQIPNTVRDFDKEQFSRAITEYAKRYPL